MSCEVYSTDDSDLDIVSKVQVCVMCDFCRQIPLIPPHSKMFNRDEVADPY
jgi:hypothetical protein